MESKEEEEPKKVPEEEPIEEDASLTSVKHFILSPLSLAVGALLAMFLIFVTIGIALLHNMERKKYENDRATVQLLRDFIIGNNQNLERASDEVIFSLVLSRTANLQRIKDIIRQVRSEARELRELSSGTVGRAHPFDEMLFYIPKKMATFDQALQECAKINATLVSVKTKEEQRFINELVHKQVASEHWIGLFRSAATNYTWTWLDKSIVNYIEYWNTWGNHPRHPRYVEGGANCVANVKQCEQKEDGIWIRCWEDKKCSEMYHFICRISKNENWI